MHVQHLSATCHVHRKFSSQLTTGRLQRMYISPHLDFQWLVNHVSVGLGKLHAATPQSHFGLQLVMQQLLVLSISFRAQ